MTKKIAVILSGCGYLDGAEIRESVITLLELDKQNAQVSIFAPDINQHHVVNHLTGQESAEQRNVMVEAARIARGEVKKLSELNAANFDGLIMPGGFGAAKNLSDIAFKGGQGVVNSDVSTIINTFHNAGKPIGAICISPALVAASLKGKHPTLTLGSENPMLKEFGASEQVCTAAQIALDDNNKIVTTPAYMCDERLANISTGISKLVSKVMELA